jgi:RecT family protein
MTTDTLPVRAEQVQRTDMDRVSARDLEVSPVAGGMRFANIAEVVKFAQLMAASGVAVPSFLRNNPGACMAVCLYAIEWRMSPYAVANKAYSVNDRLAFESQIIHAVIEQRAPLSRRLRCTYAGQGEERTCTVTGFIKGEDDPFTYTSPPFGRIQPKNSPLWKTKPDLQLYYNTSRDWARMYFPDVILGVYSDEELSVGQPARPARPSLKAALAQSVEPHPTEPSQVIDRSDAQEDPNAVIEQAAAQVREAREEAPEPDVSGTEAEAPTPDLSTEALFREAMEGLMAGQMEPAEFNVGMAKVVTANAVSRPSHIGKAAREAVYRAAAGGMLDWGTGKIGK